jgi:hypothetical protein
MSERNGSLLLFCDKCGFVNPHSVVPVRHVDDDELRQTARYLGGKGYIVDQRPDEDDAYSRNSYARGRKCSNCGTKSIWIELGAETLEHILRKIDKHDADHETIKEIEQLQRKISALIKQLKLK